MRYEAPSLEHKDIRIKAYRWRKMLNLPMGAKFPIRQVFDVLDDTYVKNIKTPFVEIGFSDEMGDNFAETDVYLKTIKFREDYYEKFQQDCPEGLITGAHEFGHFNLHDRSTLKRAQPSLSLKSLNDAEVQADIFAAELMMDYRYLKKNAKVLGIKRIAELYGIPEYFVAHHLNRMADIGEITGMIQREFEV